ncbi:hypothetical protein HGB07_00920 [Candidatus Roizmanbacteria bacterium]|nr:hypothetical protein [Candidatus Roizmanbacteria bacterium]
MRLIHFSNAVCAQLKFGNIGAFMLYALCYLSVGILVVIFKSPIRKLVDDEIGKIKIQYAVRGEDFPSFKLTIFRIMLSVVLTIIYPIMIFIIVKEKLNIKSRKEIVKQEIIFDSQPSFLKRRITVEEAEGNNMIYVDGKKIAFGYLQDKWVEICKEMKKGDELYEFRTPDESWDILAGREGVALVRRGKIVAEIITIMS